MYVGNSDEHFQLFLELLEASEFVNFSGDDDIQFHLARCSTAFCGARVDGSFLTAFVEIDFFVVVIVVMVVSASAVLVSVVGVVVMSVLVVVPMGATGTVHMFCFLWFMVV